MSKYRIDSIINEYLTKTKYLLLIFILLLSCNPKNMELYHFDPRILTEKKIILSEISDEISYLPLDNQLNLGMIYNDIIVINKSIFFSTRENGVLVFNFKGQLIRKIGNKGRGPGEYTYCHQFTVDEKRETVYILDQNEIKVFSTSGNFIRKLSLHDYAGTINTFESFNSKLFISFLPQSEGTKYDWIIIDTLGNLVKKKDRSLFPFKSAWLISGENYKYDNKVFYWDHFSDTVFSLSSELKEKPSFIIASGDHRMPKSDFSFEQHAKYLNLKQIIETKEFIIIRYHYFKPALVLINKKSKKHFLSYLEGNDNGYLAWDLSGGIKNDLDGGMYFLPNNCFIENGCEYLLGLISPFQLKEFIEGDEFKNSVPKYPEKKKNLEKIGKDLKETDNPVIVVVRLKK